MTKSILGAPTWAVLFDAMVWRWGTVIMVLVAGVSVVDAQCSGTSGRVVDHLTSAPIVGAQVLGGVDSAAVTDAEGCFLLENVYTEDCMSMQIDCAYRFSVSADGYAPYGEYGYRPPPEVDRFYTEVRLAPIAAALCFGDCGEDHAVGIDELLCAVDALLTDAESGCTCADSDGDGRLHIAEVLTAVHNALVGCVDCGPLFPPVCGPLYPPQ